MPTGFPKNLLALAIMCTPAATLAQEQTLNELVIIGDQASASALPGSAHVVSSEELEQMKYTDVQRALRQVPGVYMQEEEGYGLRPRIGIRGSGTGRSDKITLMEDSVLMAPAPYAGPAAYYFPSFGRMNGIEVLKGPDLLRYGPATVGGALNLRSTPIPDSAKGHVTTEIGEDSSKRIHAWYGASSEQAGWLIETHQMENDGFKDIQYSDRESGVDKQDFVAKFRLNSPLSANVYHQLDLKVDHSTELSNETYLGLTDEDFKKDPNQRYFASERDNMDTQRTGLMARHLVELNQDLALTTTAYYNTFKRNWYKADQLGGTSVANLVANANNGDANAIAQLRGEAAADLELKNNNREYFSRGIDFKTDWSTNLASMAHKVTFGLRYHEDEVDRFQPIDNYTQSISNGRPTLEYVSTTQPTGGNNRVEEAQAWSAFVADRVAVTNRLAVTALLRYEDIETEATRYADVDRNTVQTGSGARNTTTELLPGVGATFALGQGVTLLGGVHRGMSPAGASDTDVDPEISVNYEAGARMRRGAFYGEAIAFYSDYSNTVQNCSIANPCGSETSGSVSKGESRIAGLETLAGYELPLANGLTLPISATWTYTNAEITENSEDGAVMDGDNLAYLPENVVNVRAGVKDGERWDLYLNLTYVAKMCTDNSCERGGNTDLSETSEYQVADLSGSYRVAEGARVFARVNNLLDDQEIVARSPAGARPNLPRTAYVGMSVDF